MLRIKRKFVLFFIMLFVMITVLFAMPVLVFAQEEEALEEEVVVEPVPEKITIDISYKDVNASGVVGVKFEFQMDVIYEGEEAKLFEFVKEIPVGWSIEVTPTWFNNGITKFKLEPLKSQSFKIITRPLVLQQPGEYDIDLIVRSVEDGDTLESEASFTAIVKPAGTLKLWTSTGLFSTTINSAKDNNYKLVLENIGTAPVENITISTKDEPEGWQVDFEKELEIVESGEKRELDINIIPSEKTIAGDYLVRFIVTSDESVDYADIRLTVVTPIIWKIVGIALILFVVVGIAFIFARLGKR